MPGVNPLAAALMAQPQQPQQEPDLERWRRLAEQMAGPAEMRSYDPSMRERIGNWVYDTMSGLGMPSQAEHTRGVVEGGMDFVPGLGNVVGGEEAGRALGEGNYGEAGLLGAAALVPIPAAGKAAVKGVEKLAETLAGRKGIRAYHGSPHSFERFSTEKIGTGEGAQAYGHGLYFAEKEGVARDYRQKLSRALYETSEGTLQHGDVYDKLLSAADQVKADDLGRALHPDHRRGVVSQLLEGVDEFGSMDRYAKEYGYPEGFQKLHESVAAKAKELDVRPAKGSMYEVDIAAEPEQFLDWDKPLSQQSEAVQKIMQEQGYSEPGTGLPEQYATVGYTAGREFKDPEEVTRLREAGIPGIKFLDQGSRDPQKMKELEADLAQYREAAKHWAETGNSEKLATAQGQIAALEKRLTQTSNYVVFDDKLISILRKYGMGGMVGTAAGYEMAQHLMQQEGEQQPPVRGINPTQPTNSRLAPLLMQQLPQTAPWSPNAT